MRTEWEKYRRQGARNKFDRDFYPEDYLPVRNSSGEIVPENDPVCIEWIESRIEMKFCLDTASTEEAKKINQRCREAGDALAAWKAQ